MRFNSDQLVEFAVQVGDHEGRLTHKRPPRTLYDSALKERWFKLKANFLFYYRLNEFGGVDKNEPSGVFVLENIDIQREEGSEVPFGFVIKWKDDPDRKHSFFAQSETSVFIWIDKIIQASYEHLRAQLYSFRIKIRRKTGKDPLEHMDTPLPSPSVQRRLSQTSQFHVPLDELQVSQPSARPAVSAPSTPCAPQRNISHPLPNSLRPLSMSQILTAKLPTAKSPSLRQRFSKSPTQKKREPSRPAPVPPPRKGKKHSTGNGQVVVQELVSGVGGVQASFKCHLNDTCTTRPPATTTPLTPTNPPIININAPLTPNNPLNAPLTNNNNPFAINAPTEIPNLMD